VDDAEGVGGREGREGLKHPGDRHLGRLRAVSHERVRQAVACERHHHEGAPRVFSHVIDPQHVGVVEAGHGARLVLEPSAHPLAPPVCQPRMQQLERAVGVETLVPHTEDHRRAALTELLEQAVAAG
jgi:hypothetical protein